MKIVKKNLETLIPYARNSRTHSPEQVAQLVASIREFGWTNPVLIDEEGGVIAGHGRLLAAAEIGMKDVPCIVLAGLTEAQKKAYVIADNKLALNAGWDEEMLRLELEDLKGLDFDMTLTGFNDLPDDTSLRRELAMEPLQEAQEENLRPFSRTFFLIEVHPSDIEMVQTEIDAMRAKGVKIEQSSN